MSYPIGIFDSGYGGLTVLKSIQEAMPEYEFIYFGDNLRAPYGTKTFEEIYHNTLECVRYLFAQGCPLVILACNTASARALRTIQQRDLAKIQKYPYQRVLGVIRPTAESLGQFSSTQSVGILGTQGTIKSQSYIIEAQKFYPHLSIYQQACPTWVDFIESGKHNSEEAKKQIANDVNELLAQDTQIDCILLACTHYPLIAHHIRKLLPSSVSLLEQGDIVANKLLDYLHRHQEIDRHCKKTEKQNSTTVFLTTGNTDNFKRHATSFYNKEITVKHIDVTI